MFKALSPIFRAKFRDGIKALGLFDALPPAVWKKGWVVHSEAAGHGHLSKTTNLPPSCAHTAKHRCS